MGVALATTVVAPVAAAALACTLGRRSPRTALRAGAALAGIGFFGAAILTIGCGLGQMPALTVGGTGLIAVDRLAAVLLLLVFGVSAIVQAFAARYLSGDPRAAWFTGGAGLLTAASAGLVTASTLIGLAVCWTLAGTALCLLLGTYWHLPDARDGVRRTMTAFLIGDLALWTAVALATAVWGRIDLRGVEPGRVSGPMVSVVACLIVLAALSRSAQIPFHRWLPATLAAPTPVSALLHAGVVNAGGILLIRLSMLGTDDLARGLTVLAGIATMVYGGAVMLVKPDIKGALAHSTAAQMGFMILTCGLGLWAAAVIHLVAHGFYKATLFLSSGSAIARYRRHEALPPPDSGPARRQKWAHIAVAAGLPTLALVVGITVVPIPPGDHAAEQALLVFAWVTGVAATWGWLRYRTGVGATVAAMGFLITATVCYVGIIRGISRYLTPALPLPGLSVTTVWMITAAAVALLGSLAALRRVPGAERVRRSLYGLLLSAGHTPAARQSSSALLTGARA